MAATVVPRCPFPRHHDVKWGIKAESVVLPSSPPARHPPDSCSRSFASGTLRRTLCRTCSVDRLGHTFSGPQGVLAREHDVADGILAWDGRAAPVEPSSKEGSFARFPARSSPSCPPIRHGVGGDVLGGMMAIVTRSSTAEAGRAPPVLTETHLSRAAMDPSVSS